MRGKFFYVSFISVHIPSEENEDIIKDVFYEMLEEHMLPNPKK
jgi:hypothetical protein